MVHDFLHLMAIMIILATTYNKSIGFVCMYNMEICLWISMQKPFNQLIVHGVIASHWKTSWCHTSKLEANIQKQHVHEACRACMYEKQWVLSQKHWVLKCNLSMPKALGAKIGAFKAMHMEKMLW